RAGLTPAASAGAESLIRAVLSPSDPPTLDQLRAAGAPIDRFLAPHASPPLTVLLYRTPEPLNDRPAQQRTVSALRRALQPYPEARITGYAVLGLEAHHAVRRDFGVLTAAAGIAIGAILLLSMRSW